MAINAVDPHLQSEGTPTTRDNTSSSQTPPTADPSPEPNFEEAVGEIFDESTVCDKHGGPALMCYWPPIEQQPCSECVAIMARLKLVAGK